MPPPDLEHNQRLCELYSTALRAVRGTNYPARPGYRLARGAGGGILDWFREKHGASIVVELGGSSFTLASAQVAPFAEENFRGWLAVAELVVDDKPAPTDAGPVPDASPPDTAPDAPDAAASPMPSSPPPAPADPEPGVPPVGQPSNFTSGGIGCALAPSATHPPAAFAMLLAAVAVVLSRRRRG
jgi:uncharacterized protein (TIGR03382 family)